LLSRADQDRIMRHARDYNAALLSPSDAYRVYPDLF